jgi:hypothetical protein
MGLDRRTINCVEAAYRTEIPPLIACCFNYLLYRSGLHSAAMAGYWRRLDGCMAGSNQRGRIKQG